MRNVLAIARLTFWEGVRMRIVLVFLIVLVFILLRLPFTLKGDETLAGRLQTFLAYSLGAVSVLLALSCVFLSCTTLTGEIRSNTIHLVVTKPVSRFEILAGKWLGLNLLLLLLVVLCGLTIYGFARFIKSRPVAFWRDEISVRDVVWQARVAARPKPLRDLTAEAREWVAGQLKQGRDFSRGEEYAVAERVRELENDWRRLRPGEAEVYLFEKLIPPRRADAALQVRYRARGEPLPPLEMLSIAFAFADPDTGQPLGEWREVRESTGNQHQFLVRGQGVIRNGRAALVAANPLPPDQPTAVYFEPDGLQILYTIGTFEENYVKTLAIIAARLAFLSAVGLFFGVFVSFPVACLCTLSFYVLCLGMPFWLESIGANLEFRTDAVDPYGRFGPLVRTVLVPLLRFALPNFGHYDGSQHLIAGEYISTALLLQSLAHTLVYGLALLLVPGWLVFRAREIAEVTV